MLDQAAIKDGAVIIWTIQDGEPLPGIDTGARDWRCSMLSKALAAQGHEVVWWASTFDHAHKIHRFSQAHTFELQPGLRIRLLHGPGYRTNKSPQRWLHHRLLAHEFSKEARTAVRPDLIFASLPTIEFAEEAGRLGLEWGIPVLVDVRDLWPDHYLTLAPPVFQSLARRLLFAEFRRVRRALGQATGITAISESFLQWGLTYAARNRRETDGVFAMGYPPSRFPEAAVLERQAELIAKFNLRTDCLTIIFSGALNSIFDFDTVFRAARLLEDSGALVQFVIAGDGPNFLQLQAAAKGLANVKFTGWLDHLELTAALRLAGVGLAPYVGGQSTSGAFSNKIFEYMHIGLPLLSSLPGEIEQLIEKDGIGLYYPSDNSQLLGERILWLAQHPAECVAMGQRAHALFEEQYRADIIYPRLVTHLEKVVTGMVAVDASKLIV